MLVICACCNNHVTVPRGVVYMNSLKNVEGLCENHKKLLHLLKHTPLTEEQQRKILEGDSHEPEEPSAPRT